MEKLALILMYLAIPSLLFSLVRQLLSWKQKGSASKPRFPGPKQYPIVGRIHDLPRFSLWLKFTEWANEFGPIYYTRAGEASFVIVSDETIAEELLVKRGNIYSGRPQIRSLFKHKEGPAYSALMDRHETWQRQRKWVHAAMASAHQAHFYGVIEAETSRLLALLLLDPEDFLPRTREFCGRVMSRLAWDDATLGAEQGRSADQTLHCMSVSGPITNTVTPLWYIPERINPWKKFERKREAGQRAWWLRTFRAAKERFVRGELRADTWASRYFEERRRAKGWSVGMEGDGLDLSEEQEVDASCTLGFMNLVGVVTISGPLKFFLMAMALHPEWQRKAQEEIDMVCGDRQPTRADYENLPTVRACLKETLRWRSGVPLGVPHQCEQDDVYRGVEIKQGTIVLACEWAMNRVPSKYPDPETYLPSRWLDPSFPTYQEPLTRYPNLRDGKGMHTFGFGRRTCLGKDIADDEMFVCAAGVLWGLNMSQRVCPITGEKVPIDSQATNSHVILEPDDYKLRIEPRSAERAAQILAGYGRVREELRVQM